MNQEDMEKLTEEMVIRISDTVKGSSAKTHKYMPVLMEIDKNGNGKAKVNANGYLNAVVLPKRSFMFPNIKIYPTKYPEYVMFDFKDTSSDENTFPVKMGSFDSNGRAIQEYSKPVLAGSITVEASFGIPNTRFEILLVV